LQACVGREGWQGWGVDGTPLPYDAPHSWRQGGCWRFVGAGWLLLGGAGGYGRLPGVLRWAGSQGGMASSYIALGAIISLR
jgi:hypothetical protein